MFYNSHVQTKSVLAHKLFLQYLSAISGLYWCTFILEFTKTPACDLNTAIKVAHQHLGVLIGSLSVPYFTASVIWILKALNIPLKGPKPQCCIQLRKKVSDKGAIQYYINLMLP